MAVRKLEIKLIEFQKAGIAQLEKRLKVGEEEVWLDPKYRIKNYIESKKDEDVKWKVPKDYFSSTQEIAVKDYLVARVMDIEPFMV